MAILNVLPTLSTPNASDLRFRNPKLSGNAVFAFLRGANLLDLFGSKFRLFVVHSHRVTFGLPSLGVTICRVLLRRAEKKVLNGHTKRHVAAMTDKHSLWNWTIRHFPCHPMRPAVFPGPRNDSVTTRCFVSRPQHASRGVWTGVMRNALRKRPVASNSFMRRNGHSLNCSSKAVAGQGRTSRYNANRPALLSAKMALKFSKKTVFMALPR